MIAVSGCKRRDDDVSDPAAIKISTEWISDFDAALTKAKGEQKPVFAAFFGDSCSPCRAMKGLTFSTAPVSSELTNWVSVIVDVDKRPDLGRRFKVNSIPEILLINPDGKVMSRKEGLVAPGELVAFVVESRKALSK